MRLNVNKLICSLLLSIGLASCMCIAGEPDWIRVQAGETDKSTILKWFGEPQSEFINPTTHNDRSQPWEYWFYEDGVYLGFRGSDIVEALYLPRDIDPLLRDGYTVEEMVEGYGLPEVVYEYYTETTEGIGIDGWSFIYPTRGDQFMVSSMFVILPGEPNQPPPPTLELLGHCKWAPSTVEDWLRAGDEERVHAGGTRIEIISGYFDRMDPTAFFYKPVVPPRQ